MRGSEIQNARRVANQTAIKTVVKKKTQQVRTNNHASELESLSDALPVDLVGKVGETDVTHEFFPDDAGQVMRAAVGGDGSGRLTAVGGRSTVAVCTVRSVRLGRRRRRDTGTGHGRKEEGGPFLRRGLRYRDVDWR